MQDSSSTTRVLAKKKKNSSHQRLQPPCERPSAMEEGRLRGVNWAPDSSDDEADEKKAP